MTAVFNREVYNAPFSFKMTCVSRVIDRDQAHVDAKKFWRVNPVLYVVITAVSDQTVYYELRLFSDTYCVCIKIKNALIY